MTGHLTGRGTFTPAQHTHSIGKRWDYLNIIIDSTHDIKQRYALYHICIVVKYSKRSAGRNRIDVTTCFEDQM